VYRETNFKKFYDGPATASIGELTFAQIVKPAIAPDTVGVLASINRHTPVTIAEADAAGQRFRLTSRDFADLPLFNALRKDWPIIVGWRILGFALIYRMGGANRGIWLEQLTPGTSASLHGCHQYPS
jgi:hypothetical protein